MVAVEAFLTAYDPTDLPSMSIDPLGFERGYLFLADKILPGLTTVTDVPRYFGVLCAGILLGEVDRGLAPRRQYEARREAALRFERLWALACGLAARRGDLPIVGLRGLRYVEREIERLERREEKQAGAGFKLLSRQAPYGVVGIYGNVASGMRLVEWDLFDLTPGAGEPLAQAFIDESDVPKAVRRAVREDSAVSIQKLADWGDSAFVTGMTGPREAACLREALHAQPVRSRMAALLAAYPGGDEERELARLRRIADACEGNREVADLREAMVAILHYEACYQLALLGFERLLWLSSQGPVSAAQRRSDRVLAAVRERLSPAVETLRRVLETAGAHLGAGIDRLHDVRQFLARLAAAARDPLELAQALVDRHADVQHGKFDRGRRKTPWLEVVGDDVGRTATRIGGLAFEADAPDDILPHGYRFAPADALLRAGGAS